MSDEFLTVSELNHFIRDVLNSGFPKSCLGLRGNTGL